MDKSSQKAAAFYDLEGTLVSTNLVHTLGFYAQRQQGLLQTFKKSAMTLVKLPFFGLTDLYSRNVFNEVFFKSYKGESADRLRFFSEELFEKVLKPAIFDGTFEMIKTSKKLGLRPLADDNLIESEQAQTIARAIATLPEKYRAPIVLRDVEGKTYEEIGEILQLGLGTTKSRISRARGLLKEKLKNYF
jgi:RNA polymerase sigma factor (sigma-70 family)